MESALQLLDAAKMPLGVDAHLDLAIRRLKEFLSEQRDPAIIGVQRTQSSPGTGDETIQITI